jgi:hypothetical protein
MTRLSRRVEPAEAQMEVRKERRTKNTTARPQHDSAAGGDHKSGSEVKTKR